MAARIVQTRNGRDLAVPLLSLSQPYTGATAVLVDELDAAAFIAQQLAKLLATLRSTLAYLSFFRSFPVSQGRKPTRHDP
jgi:hypothetical protein